MKTPYALICYDCYNYIKNGIFIQTNTSKIISNVEMGGVYIDIDAYCPCCNKETNFFSVDNNVAPLVSVLNKNNYITEYSCQGHSRISINKLKDNVYDVNYFYNRPYVSINIPRSRKANTKITEALEKYHWTDVSISYTTKADDYEYYNSLITTLDKLDDDVVALATSEQTITLRNISIYLDESEVLDYMTELVDSYSDDDNNLTIPVSKLNEKVDKWFAKNIKELANVIEAININEEK